MFRTNIHSAEKYDYFEGKFLAAYEFLRREDLGRLSEGSIALEGGAVASVQCYTTVPPEEGKFETHDRHFDIQFLVSGEETIEVADRGELVPCTPYDAGGDITFYREPERRDTLRLQKGDLVVLSPGEAHKPRICIKSPELVKKIVIKVPV